VITADIPMAAEVVAKHAFALNPRGEFVYQGKHQGTPGNARFYDWAARGTGQISGGSSAFGQRDKQAFANALDRFLAVYS
jgi:uncharacterized protein